MFRRRKSLHVHADFGDNADGGEGVFDTRSALKDGKFLLIGSSERKNEFFKFCFLGFWVMKVFLDYLELSGLLGSNKAINGIPEFRKFLFQTYRKGTFRLGFSLCKN